MARRRLIGPDHFGGLLVLIVVSIIATPFIEGHEGEGVVVGLLAGTLAVGALVASGVRRGVVVVAAVTVAVLTTLTTAGSLAGDGAPPAWVFLLIALMVAATPVLVLRRVLHHRAVTLATVAGALSAYLLVGLAFSALYRAVAAYDADAFSTELGAASVYFSFVTLTTIGYGDIVATSDVARSFVVLEAVLGQILLVTLVARFVTTLGQLRPQPAAGSPGEGEATSSADA